MDGGAQVESASDGPIVRTVGAVLGALVGAFGGPIGSAAGAAFGVAVEEGITRYRAHRARRAEQLGSAAEAGGMSAEDLEALFREPRTMTLVLRAVQVAADTTNDLHVRALADSLQRAATGDPVDLDIAEITVETLARMTDADVVVLKLVDDEVGRDNSFQEPPDGAPPALVTRLVGLGLLTFDGLYTKVNELGATILDTLNDRE